MSFPSFFISRLKHKKLPEILKGDAKAKPEAAYNAPRFWILGSFFAWSLVFWCAGVLVY
jgi:hypothetical protein